MDNTNKPVSHRYFWIVIIAVALVGCGQSQNSNAILDQPPTSESITALRSWPKSTNASRPESCPGDIINGSMNYEAMMKQQLCVRDLMDWPTDYYPIIRDSHNNQYVQGMFEQNYAFTPMRIANSCAYIEWWRSSQKENSPKATEITAYVIKKLPILYEGIPGMPDTASATKRFNQEISSAISLGDISRVTQQSSQMCGSWSWTQAPEFVVPTDMP